MTRAVPLPTKRMLTTEEAAGYCGVGVTALKAHVRVAPVQIGSRALYDVRALDRWLDHRESPEPVSADDWLGRLDEDQREGN